MDITTVKTRFGLNSFFPLYPCQTANSRGLEEATQSDFFKATKNDKRIIGMDNLWSL